MLSEKEINSAFPLRTLKEMDDLFPLVDIKTEEENNYYINAWQIICDGYEDSKVQAPYSVVMDYLDLLAIEIEKFESRNH